MPIIIPEDMKRIDEPKPMPLSQAIDIAIERINHTLDEMERVAWCMTPEIEKRFEDLRGARDRLLKFKEQDIALRKMLDV